MNYDVLAQDEHVSDYWSLFVNRRAYTVQSQRPDANGRHNYFLAKEFLPGQRSGPPEGPPKALSQATIRDHLEGRLTIGLYAMNPETQRCKWLAIDADYERSFFDLYALRFELKNTGIEAALERSRRGGHLWIFLETPCLALEGRLFIAHLASQLKMPVKGTRDANGQTQVEGLEIFPKQDVLKPGTFGNGVRGPLGIHQASGIRYYFDGANSLSLGDQIAYLKSVRKLTEAELRALVDKLPPPEPKPSNLVSFRIKTRFDDRKQFCILDYVQVDQRRIVSGNYVVPCPSCQQQGKDKHGDNLHILVENPNLYVCRAGCNKYQIREALGCPIQLAASGGVR